MFHRICSFVPTGADFNLKTNLQFKPVPIFISSPKIVSSVVVGACFLLKIFHEFLRSEKRKKKDDPAYFESQRKHVPQWMWNSKKVKVVPIGNPGWSRREDLGKCLWKPQFSILKWYLSLCISKTHPGCSSPIVTMGQWKAQWNLFSKKSSVISPKLTKNKGRYSSYLDCKCNHWNNY